ncbi:unnamed protein product [Symbiodinium necroappetens]|uniref:Uncharacterized protein n=1 Tax=Symbiodinium necroappetens TaxID=1628268 RepID=A0A813CFK0_9DINO|nr:unnamed protein product [Symbiodinium necroappetens]
MPPVIKGIPPSSASLRVPPAEKEEALHFEDFQEVCLLAAMYLYPNPVVPLPERYQQLLMDMLEGLKNRMEPSGLAEEPSLDQLAVQAHGVEEWDAKSRSFKDLQEGLQASAESPDAAWSRKTRLEGKGTLKVQRSSDKDWQTPAVRRGCWEAFGAPETRVSALTSIKITAGSLEGLGLPNGSKLVSVLALLKASKRLGLQLDAADVKKRRSEIGREAMHRRRSSAMVKVKFMADRRPGRASMLNSLLPSESPQPSRMAVLAIEGHKKLEAAQQELYDAFSACFKTVNGRSVETWQPHETIMLCNDTTFFDLTGMVSRPRRAQKSRVVANAARMLATGITSDPTVFRILAPTAILGYGFPEAPFDVAVREHAFNLIAVDAGSIDPGPYYLASRSSFTSLDHVLRDLRLMLQGVRQQASMGQRCKLIVGSAGGCGTNNQVELLAREARRMMAEIGLVAPIATVQSELQAVQLAGRQLTPLGLMPAIGTDALEGSVIVAQMGLEPIMSALGHADIVLCGRAYDPAVFAAEPIRCGFPASAALHAAKVLECGAIATVPGSGSDCLVAELDRGQATARFWAPNRKRQATALSVAAHTLYEKSHPHLFGLPGGVLSTKHAVFKQRGRVVEVEGTKLTRVPPAVKLEGARVRGFRTVAIDFLPGTADVEPSDSTMVYGRNGVEDSWVNSGEELGILVTVSGGGIERNRSHLALLRATLLHWGFDGRKATAGNLAFPFSPSDLQFGDEGVLTICGTRDPSFISRWQEILKEVEDYVQSLSCQEGLTVRFVAAGLQGQHLLQCREVVASTAAAARTQLQADPRAIESWLCHGSVAADYTVHHLLDLDEKLLRDLFPIRVLHSDGSEEDVEATLLPWDAPPTASSAEAYQDWESSAKPSGWRVAGCNLGDLAKVVRSKNAGVNEITYDLMFADEESYNYAKSSPALDASAVPLQNILGIFCDDTCWAIKITCARQVLAGSAGDRDVYGAQQHSRLLSVQL